MSQQKKMTNLFFLIHFFSLINLVLCQPLYSIIGKYPHFLVAHHLEYWEVLSLPIFFSFAFPLIFILPLLMIKTFSPTCFWTLSNFFIFLLLELFIFQIVKYFGGPLWIFLLFLTLFAGLFWKYYMSQKFLFTFVSFLFPTIFVVPCFFLSPPQKFGPQRS